jgi:uncharacterized membrane protein
MANIHLNGNDTVVLLVGTYDNEDVLQDDFEALKALHKNGEVYTYDAAIVIKEDGKVKIRRHSLSTKYGAWTGLAVGTLLGLFFPPALIIDAATGTAVGALAGHFFNDIPKDDLKALGHALDETEKALVIIADVAVSSDVARALAHAKFIFSREVTTDTRSLQDAIRKISKS